jgi:hypothetical protein
MPAVTKQYLVITEFSNTGHIIGSFDTLEEAKRVCNAVFDQQNPDGTDKELYEHTHELQTYPIHPTGDHMVMKEAHLVTNGLYSAYVFDTSVDENFSLEQFMFVRKNTIYVFNMDDYDLDKLTYFNVAEMPIAN